MSGYSCDFSWSALSSSVTNTSSSVGCVSSNLQHFQCPGLPASGPSRPGHGSTGRRSSLAAPRDCGGDVPAGRRVLAVDLQPARARRRDAGHLLQFLRRAERQQLGQIDVADAAAALGLVHVVRGDDQRDALGRQAEQQVPQVAAGHRVDAGRRLVQEDQPRPVHQGTHQGQALLPAAGEPAGVAIHVGSEPGQLDQFLLALAGLLRRQAIDAGVKVHVLVGRQILVQGKLLRHVADLGTRLVPTRCQRPGPAPSAVPAASGIRPHSPRISVVLPEPFGPSRPKTSPWATVRLT